MSASLPLPSPERLDRAFHRAEIELEARLVLYELVRRNRAVDALGEVADRVGNASDAVGEARFVDGEARRRRRALSRQRRRSQVELSKRKLLRAQEVFALGLGHWLERAQARFELGEIG